MRSTRAPALAALLIASLTTPSAAQTNPAPPQPKNLQVLPQDTPAQEVVALMQQFNSALGVQCTFCHVQAPPQLLTPEETAAGVGRGRGQGPPPMDFAADTKPQKNAARAMLSMTRELNARLPDRLGRPAAAVTQVECVTCHRGVSRPEQLSDLLAQTMLTKGDGAAVATYRELRQKYYGSQAYDFREGVLVTLARQSLANSKPDDAVAWMQLNLEFYPKSSASYTVLAQARVAKRDDSGAVKDLEKALELDSQNGEAKRQLDKLRPHAR